MIIRKCDRCGKTIGTLETYAVIEWNVYRYGETDDSTMSIDLCPHCYDNFLEFLSTKSVKDEKGANDRLEEHISHYVDESCNKNPFEEDNDHE